MAADAHAQLGARPIYHRKRDSIEAHLTIVFAALAVTRWIEAQTGWTVRKFVKTARAGLDVVLADVEQPALQAAEQQVAGLGAKTLAVPIDVSDEAAVNALAAAAVDRFGAVHVVCNNAGVATNADPWFGPVSAWSWVLGVTPS